MDYEKIESVFKKYIEKYDMNNDKIKLKYDHSFEVAKLMEELAVRLKFNEEDCKLSKSIGLLHDIGRFEQLKLYNTFKDTEFDHADEGADYLVKRGHIKDFIDDRKYDKIIYDAIKNHNKYEIKDVDEDSLIYSKMIRDMDKVDILRVFTIIFSKVFDKDTISDNIKGSFYDKKSCLIKDRVTSSDSIIFVLSFIFDFNYKESLEILKEKGYFYEFLNKIEIKEGSKEVFDSLVKYVEEYIEERLAC